MAPIYALEDIEDAFELTRALLTPFDRSQWLRLALVAFFVGGAGSAANPFQWLFSGGNGGSTDVGGSPGTGGFDVTTELLLLVAVIVVAFLAIALAFAFVGAVMEFVFVESLREREVHVREYASAHWRRGLRLFGFRVAVGLLALAGVAVLVAPLVFAALDPGSFAGGLFVLSIFVLFAGGFALALVLGLVSGFTTAFVVPVMLVDDCGVLAGWKRLLSSIRSDPIQYVAYALAGVFLGIGASTFVAFAAGMLVLVLLVPFAVLFGIGFAVLAAGPDLLGLALLVVVGVLFALAVAVTFALVQVPVVTFLRYYALLVLGDVTPDLDAIPDQRASVREPEPTESTAT
ncbi:hypothetical protein G9C85_07775 [Halorubellus sp. JP-L1]|uniref:DUF7544 domain-containing protein n=1 Tax=Halorubellus sp. JP-L1 TaxID=2715753 RepID=UPI001408AEEE|nr:hypothetical protein [Halorubellus sp. JP-L1]NHN41536.1 hypothetical protein [Halorubellus sp. JP-L1]